MVLNTVTSVFSCALGKIVQSLKVFLTAENFRVEFNAVSGIAQCAETYGTCVHVYSSEKICQISIWSETQQQQNYNG
jgi:hypothetical protein